MQHTLYVSLSLALVAAPARADEPMSREARTGVGAALGAVGGALVGGLIGYQVAKPEQYNDNTDWSSNKLQGPIGGVLGGALGLFLGAVTGGVVAYATAPAGSVRSVPAEERDTSLNSPAFSPPAPGVRPRPRSSSWITSALIGAGVGLLAVSLVDEEQRTGALLLPLTGAAIGGWMGYVPEPTRDRTTVGLSWGGTF